MAGVNNKIRDLENEQLDLNAEQKKLTIFMKTFAAQPVIQTKFNDKTFLNTIEYIEASARFLTYHFYGGESVKVEIEMLKLSCSS